MCFPSIFLGFVFVCLFVWNLFKYRIIHIPSMRCPENKLLGYIHVCTSAGLGVILLISAEYWWKYNTRRHSSKHMANRMSDHLCEQCGGRAHWPTQSPVAPLSCIFENPPETDSLPEKFNQGIAFFHCWGATAWMLVSSHTGQQPKNTELKLYLTNSSLYTEDPISYKV